MPIATQVARQLHKDVPREGRGRGGRGFGSHFGVPQETQNPTKYGKVPPGRSLCLGPGNLEKEHRLVDPPERPKCCSHAGESTELTFSPFLKKVPKLAPKSLVWEAHGPENRTLPLFLRDLFLDIFLGPRQDARGAASGGRRYPWGSRVVP